MTKIFSRLRNVSSTWGRLGGVILFLLICNTAPAQYIVHIAGGDSCGHSGDGGLAILASFNNPAGICRDTAGNLYIGDGSAIGENDARVRKIDSATGIITTIAGGVRISPIDTGDNVPATSVNLNDAGCICIDRTGNLLIADGIHYHLRKVNLATGIITTIAGNGDGRYGGDGGPATAAQLARLYGIAVDTANNIYIAQPTGIRKITAATGIISTIAGVPDTSGFRGDGGPATNALLNNVLGVYVDRNSNIYIADNANYRIRKVSAATGIITTVAGGCDTCVSSGDGGPATVAGLRSPINITMDTAGNLYIADLGDFRIRKVDAATGIIATFAGNRVDPSVAVDSAGDGGPATAAIVYPYGMCFDGCGNLYFADGGCRIRAITPSLPFTATCRDTTAINRAPQQAVANTALQVYPDPNQGSFTICLSADNTAQAQITITNIIGQKIKELTTTTNKKEEVQLTAPPGMYFINAVTEQGRWSGKVVVQ